MGRIVLLENQCPSDLTFILQFLWNILECLQTHQYSGMLTRLEKKKNKPESTIKIQSHIFSNNLALIM